MPFNKIVKAPTRMAHIKNFPHKKSEAEQQRMVLLLYHAQSLVLSVIMFKGKAKLDVYRQMRDVEKELKTLRCYQQWMLNDIIRRAKYEDNKLRRAFF